MTSVTHTRDPSKENEVIAKYGVRSVETFIEGIHEISLHYHAAVEVKAANVAISILSEAQCEKNPVVANQMINRAKLVLQQLILKDLAQ